MNDKQQIKEMARTMGGCHITPNCKTCDEKSGTTSCYNKIGAKNLYNAGYRKIPENAVVLTMTEHAKLVAQIRQEFEVEYKDKVVLTREEFENMQFITEFIGTKQKIGACDFNRVILQRTRQVRKETAREIFATFADLFPKEKGISSSHAKIHRCLNELTKKYDVEIKE